MQLFYTPDVQSSVYTLNREESRHISKVMRLKVGDIIHLTDGRGRMMECSLLDNDPKGVSVQIVKGLEDYGKRDLHIHMVVAPTKNIDRFEWFLEKATEIGIEEITPILCEHSERKVIRHDRLERVITAAMKQSLKAYHPVLNELTPLKQFLNEDISGRKFIAHLDEKDPKDIKHLYQKEEKVTIMIGPEGDFSSEEVQKAVDTGFEMAALGTSRLRTETAAVAACHAINLLYDL